MELITVQLAADQPSNTISLVWVTHNFAFLGGSLGCAEGEKITRAFEYGLKNGIPVVVQCRTGTFPNQVIFTKGQLSLK